MPLKTDAKVTVDAADMVLTNNLGFNTENANGATEVPLPAHVAKLLEDEGAVTVTTAADRS